MVSTRQRRMIRGNSITSAGIIQRVGGNTKKWLDPRNAVPPNGGMNDVAQLFLGFPPNGGMNDVAQLVEQIQKNQEVEFQIIVTF